MYELHQKGRYVITSESVTEGHPDKVCDQVSDAILDALISEDPDSRVACETVIVSGMVLVAGEITTKTYIEIPDIARNIIKQIGYTNHEYGFSYDTCAILTSINAQSPDIALGVNKLGAGDQGMMFGYATDENQEYMPTPILLAHKIAKRLAEVRKTGKLPYLRPDGKCQVSVEYENAVPKRVTAVVLSAQHSPEITQEQIKKDLIKNVIKPSINNELYDENINYYINPTGRFVLGGPRADTGLTGRKIIVDTYGGVVPHGGGAFSGKDPTKVDRSAAYMARYIAKNLVASGFGKRIGIQLAYAIGIAEPVSILATSFGTGKIPDEQLVKIIRKNFPLTPHGIIEKLNLKRPIYTKTACYGHFGRVDGTFTWENLDMIDNIK